VNADNIVVSGCSRQAMFNACFTLFDVGDEVLMALPYPSSHPDLIRLARARPVPVRGDAEWSLKVGVAELDAAANAQTKGLLLSTPVNPTGAVYTRPELKALLQWAADRRIWVVCDEVYRRIHFGSGPAPSVLDLPDELLERVVMVTGTGPAYAMAGWGVGLTLAPRAVAEWIWVLQSGTGGGAAHPAQWAAAAALNDVRTEPDLDRMVDAYRARRDAVVEHFRLHMPGVEYVEPLGGYHFFFRADSCFVDDVSSAAAFCQRLLAERGVALRPGEVHGDDRWVRLSYSVPQKDLVEALIRISDLAATLTARSF
jgi:aspartate aminotransferase